MKLPKSLKIGGHTYKVIFEPDEAITTNGHSCGIYNREKGIIAINSNLIQSEQESTFFHEVLHCINSELNEITVESLAQQLYQVLSSNKLLRG